MLDNLPAIIPKCPVCGISSLEGVVANCPRCETPQHTDCTTYQGGCARYGCKPASGQAKPVQADRRPIDESILEVYKQMAVMRKTYHTLRDRGVSDDEAENQLYAIGLKAGIGNTLLTRLVAWAISSLEYHARKRGIVVSESSGRGFLTTLYNMVAGRADTAKDPAADLPLAIEHIALHRLIVLEICMSHGKEAACACHRRSDQRLRGHESHCLYDGSQLIREYLQSAIHDQRTAMST